MAGDVRATLTVAIGRALAGAALTGFVTYFTTLSTVEDECEAKSPPATQNCEPGDQSAEQKALYAALAAGGTFLLARGGFEGAADARRQANDKVKPSDVQGS